MQVEDSRPLIHSKPAVISKIVFSKLRGYVLWSHEKEGEVSYSLHGWGTSVTGINKFFLIKHPSYLRNRFILTGKGATSAFLIELSRRELRSLLGFIDVEEGKISPFWML